MVRLQIILQIPEIASAAVKKEGQKGNAPLSAFLLSYLHILGRSALFPVSGPVPVRRLTFTEAPAAKMSWSCPRSGTPLEKPSPGPPEPVWIPYFASIIRSLANSPPLASPNFFKRSSTWRFFFSSPATS